MDTRKSLSINVSPSTYNPLPANPKYIYSIEILLELRENDFSFVKPLKVVKIWRRRLIFIEDRPSSPQPIQSLYRAPYDPTFLNQAKAHSQTLFKKEPSENYASSVQDMLNKLTPQHLNKFQLRLFEISCISEENLKLVVEKIFIKACLEKKYRAMWAELCLYLFEEYQKMMNISTNRFKTVLLNIMQKSFEQFEDNTEASGTQKVKKIGNVAFIGELFKLKIISAKIIVRCLNNLLTAAPISAKNEVKIEAACVLLMSCGKECHRFQESFSSIMHILKDLSENRLVSSRIRFIIMVTHIQDVIDAKLIDF
jgi:hypothetical protein